MKFMIFFFLISTALAESSLSNQAQATLDEILSAQGSALESLEGSSIKKNSSLAQYEMNEMITDIGLTKSGLLGLATLKSTHAVEIKWKKKTQQSQNLISKKEEETADFIIKEELSQEELVSTADAIAQLVETSGKIKAPQKLKENLLRNLNNINETIRSIQVTEFKHWQLSGLRIDLNIAASGEVWYFTKAGAIVRVRLEWKFKRAQLNTLVDSQLNSSTKFVLKMMNELNEAMQVVPMIGFTPKRVTVGVGATYDKGLHLWKGSAGLFGGLIFAPSERNGIVERAESLSAEVEQRPFYISEVHARKHWLTRLFEIKSLSFRQGLIDSLKMANKFAERALLHQRKNWEISEIKTINEISKTGLFSLASISGKGVMEIDYKKR